MMISRRFMLISSIVNSHSSLNQIRISSLCAPNQIRNQSSANNTTLNECEINKFRYYSKNWWSDKHLKPLIEMNELRVPFITKAFHSIADRNSSKPLKGIKLLDIGCGQGFLSEPLATLGAHMTAIDPIDTNISLAINHMNEEELWNQIDYKCATIEQLSNTAQYVEYFDGVIASEVIEHIDNVELFINCSLKCLKKGGHILLTTMNQTIYAYLVGILIAENVLDIVSKGTHQYEMFVTPKALTMLLEQNGCSVTLIHGMAYKPFSGRWVWTQSQAINYALRAIKK